MAITLGILRRLQRAYSLILLLLLWQVLSSYGLLSPRVFPPLQRILEAGWQDLAGGVIPYHAWITIYRTLAGFAIGTVAGVLFGFLLARVRWAEYLFEPIFFAGYPVPKIALFPIFAFIFGLGTPSKIAFAAIECLYPIVVATYMACRNIPKELVWAAENMGMRGRRLWLHVLIPATLSSIISGLRIALPVGMTIVVVTEMIGDTHGLGFYITYAGTTFRYDKLYAGLLTIGIIGFVFDFILTKLRGRILKWETAREG